MNSNIENIIYETASSTFEDLCFMFVEPDFEDEPLPIEDGLASVIGFTGPLKGKMIIKAGYELISMIASNMLGDEMPTEQQKIDALGEVSNILCGNILPGIVESKKAVFNMTSPDVMKFTELQVTENEKITAEVNIPLDEGLAEIKFFIYND